MASILRGESVVGKTCRRFSKEQDGEDDLQVIEILRHEKPSISFSEISHILQENGGVQDISISDYLVV